MPLSKIAQSIGLDPDQAQHSDVVAALRLPKTPSPRLALEGALRGFLNDTRSSGLSSSIIIMYSQRDSEAPTAPDSETCGSVGQHDYVTWVGAPALVCWGPEAEHTPAKAGSGITARTARRTTRARKGRRRAE